MCMFIYIYSSDNRDLEREKKMVCMDNGEKNSYYSFPLYEKMENIFDNDIR